MRESLFLATVLAMCAAVSLTMDPGAARAAEAETKTKKPKKQRPPVKQDKRTGQSQIIPIIDGKPRNAVKLCQKFLETHPNHPESLYNLTLAWCRLGDQEKALDCMSRAIVAGLPAFRFVAGPRGLLEPLTETAEFQQLVAEHADQLVHGPMLGCVTDRSARFWVRTVDEVPLQVLLSTRADLTRPLKSPTVFSQSGRD